MLAIVLSISPCFSNIVEHKSNLTCASTGGAARTAMDHSRCRGAWGRDLVHAFGVIIGSYL